MTWRYVLPLVLAGGLVAAGVGCSNSSTNPQPSAQNPGVTAHERPMPGAPGGAGPATKGAANKPKGID